jgi:hypothetical protein
MALPGGFAVSILVVGFRGWISVDAIHNSQEKIGVSSFFLLNELTLIPALTLISARNPSGSFRWGRIWLDRQPRLPRCPPVFLSQVLMPSVDRTLVLRDAVALLIHTKWLVFKASIRARSAAKCTHDLLPVIPTQPIKSFPSTFNRHP